jgi:hypothetical protein
MPWFLSVSRDEVLKTKFLSKQRKNKSAREIANELILAQKEADIKAKKDEIEDLEEQIGHKEKEVADLKNAIETTRQSDAFTEEIKQTIIQSSEESLNRKEVELQELKDQMDLLMLEVDEEAGDFLSGKTLGRLKSALDRINYRHQLRFFKRKASTEGSFHAFILQGNKESANDFLVRLLLIEVNSDDKVGIKKTELDFSTIGSDAPNEGNIWVKVKKNFDIPEDKNEKEATEIIIRHLANEHVIFHFKRMYDFEPSDNLNIIRKFWYTFCEHAKAGNALSTYSHKCYLFVSDENCHCQEVEPYVLGRGYTDIIPQQDRSAYLLDVMDPPVQPILLEDLKNWELDEVPLAYQLKEEQKLKKVLGGNYGFILPTIRNYCEEIGSWKLYNTYFSDYEINDNHNGKNR